MRLCSHHHHLGNLSYCEKRQCVHVVTCVSAGWSFLGTAIRRPKSVLARTCQEGGVAKNRAPTISCRIILSRTHWIDSRGSIEFHPLVQTRMFMDFGVEWKSWIYRDVEIVHKTLHCGSQHLNKAIARGWYLRGEFLLPYKFEFVIHLLVDGRNSPHDTLIGN